MHALFHKYKPAAPARYHLFVAALLWSVVGSALLFFGCKWVINKHETLYIWLLIPALLIGLLKTRLVLFKAADRMTSRIIARGDGKCIGGFISYKTWLIIAIMAGTGKFLRGGLLPIAIVGLIYAAVGIALLYGSSRLWSARKEFLQENN